jgi:hypothetical protein
MAAGSVVSCNLDFIKISKNELQNYEQILNKFCFYF